MRTRQSSLSVYPNPYLELDGFGNPVGIVPCDPHEHTPDRRWVGAKISKIEVLETLPKGDLRSPRQDTFFEFNIDVPTPLPQTAYYLDRLRHGALFAADEDTAKKAGCAYLPIAEALSAAKQQAISYWESLYGQGTCPLSEE